MIFWTDFFIKRPIFSCSISILLVIFGCLGFSQLEIRLYPKLESSTIQITLDYPGASATTMRNFVTRRIYDGLSNLDSLDYITANNQEGEANIYIHFKIGSSAQKSMNQVLINMMSLKASLPTGVHDPNISIVNSSENPDWLLAFTTKDENTSYLSDYLTRIIKPYFDVVSGISSVQILGANSAINIYLNPDLMKAYGLESSDIVLALEQQNRLSLEGWLESKHSEFKVKLNSILSSPNDLGGIVLKKGGQSFVHLSDVSKIEWGPETDKILSFYNKNPAVLVSVKTASHSNMLEVLKSLNEKLNKIRNELPPGVSVHELVNGRHYILAVMHEMLLSFLISLAIVVLISIHFFNNIRAAIMIVLVIPISLFGTGIILWVCGASIDLLSLLAMILVIGLLVDDAIVVVENIFRYNEKGFPILEACYSASREIAFPLISMTLTLASLFFPITFLGGITGRLFWEFSLTLVTSVLISGLVALTLLPMLSSKFLKKDFEKNMYFDYFYDKLKEKYFQILKDILDRKKTVIGIWVLVSFMGIVAYSHTPKNFVPKEDARLLEVIAQVPTAANTHFLLGEAKMLGQIYREISDIHSYSLLVGVPSSHQLLSFIRLKSFGESQHSLMKIQQLLQEKIKQNSINAVALIPSLMPGTQGMPLEFVIKSQLSYRDLYEVSEKFIRNGRKSDLFLFLGRDLQYDEPTLELQINRSTAALTGVSAQSLESAISNLMGENTLQYVSNKGALYPVIIKSNLNLETNPDFLSGIFVKGKNGNSIALSNLLEIKQKIEPEQENQFQKLNSITISGVLRPGYSLSEGIHFFKKQAKLILPESVSYDFSGNAREFIIEGHRMTWLFLAAFFIIFIVLSIQFESFLDPFIILLGSLPVGIFGAMLPFELGVAKMNIYSEIGILVLCGLISKQGILITHFAKVQSATCCQKTAILQAISTRFRPILMTTFAILLGILPLLLSGGPGYEARFSLGLVIFSGMLFGSLFSLFILPILYLSLHQQKQEV